jgi:FkbM family methyltransferase
MKSVFRMLRALAKLRNRKTWGPFVEAAETSGFDHSFTISWSQAGEDLAVLSLLGNEPKGTYLDIGAHHPTRFSVTRHLYQRGWNGVNVDANSELIEEFNKKRTRDINLCCAVGEEESYEFTVFHETAISTVNSSWKDKFLSESNAIKRIEQVPGRSLRDIYNEHFPQSPVDLLTVDAEGADFEIIRSMHFESLPAARFPRYLMLESSSPLNQALETPAVTMAMSLGYNPQLVLPMVTILKRAE